MKKFFSISVSLISVLTLLLVAATPVAAASYVVMAVSANTNGTVVVYIDAGSSPYFANPITYSGFDSYPTNCTPNGANLLACHIQGQIAKQHPDQTAYIIINSSGDKVWFVVPEAPEVHHNNQQCNPGRPSFKPCPD